MRLVERRPHRAPAQQWLKQVGEGAGGTVAEKWDGGRLSYQRSDRASAQLGSSVIRGSDRCFLDNSPPEALEEHTGGQLFP